MLNNYQANPYRSRFRRLCLVNLIFALASDIRVVSVAMFIAWERWEGCTLSGRFARKDSFSARERVLCSWEEYSSVVSWVVDGIWPWLAWCCGSFAFVFVNRFMNDGGLMPPCGNRILGILSDSISKSYNLAAHTYCSLSSIRRTTSANAAGESASS